MKKTFDYFYTQQSNDQICIEDIGNCCIQANTDFGEFSYLMVKTKLGVTRAFQFGPVEDNAFPTMYSCWMNQFDYDEKKIIKIINKFINNFEITQVQEVDCETVKSKFKNPMDYFEDKR